MAGWGIMKTGAVMMIKQLGLRLASNEAVNRCAATAMRVYGTIVGFTVEGRYLQSWIAVSEDFEPRPRSPQPDDKGKEVNHANQVVNQV